MIKIDEGYTDYYIGNDPGYPGGKAIDTPDPESIEGTPIKSAWFNDIIGFFQAAIVRAKGAFEVSGVPDKVGASDILNALEAIEDEKIENERDARVEEDEALAEALTDLENRVDEIEAQLPLGSDYVQYMNSPSPIEKGLPGVWQVWNHRADAYGLLLTSLPAYTTYTANANYAINAYVMYHLLGDDYGIYRAKEAITAAPAQLDPVKWEKITPSVIVERKDLQGWTDADFAIDHQLVGGTYAGWRVCEVIVSGGKFPSFAGGNRPTFISGGVAEGQMKNIIGQVLKTGGSSSIGVLIGSLSTLASTGALSADNGTGQAYNVSGGVASTQALELNFNASRVVRTGPDFSPRSLSVKYWRRVA